MIESKLNVDLFNELTKASPFFQRSISIKYDSATGEYIQFYVPTPRSADAFEEIFSACINKQSQRAHIFSGPYGVGKSIFSLVLMAFLEQPDQLQEYLNSFTEKLLSSYPEITNTINDYLNSGKKYLPVVLSGDEGPFDLALSRSLVLALRQRNIEDINPKTIYAAVKDKIIEWETEYPNAYYDFQEYLKSTKGISLQYFLNKIDLCDINAYNTFMEIYPKVTAGSQFNFIYNQSPIQIFDEVSKELYEKYDYDGIFVIYDEFGRFLESRIGEPFGKEAELLQDFAEYCNRTSSPIVHFICITHKIISQYAQGLSEDIRLEWQKIEGRFKSLSLTGDNEVNYKLLKEALCYLNQTLVKELSTEKKKTLDDIIRKAVDLNLLDLPPEDIADVMQSAYPLHPMTVYCLPELSQKVAQNERTLFTFLFSRDDFSLGDLLTQGEFVSKRELPFVYVDQIYDYFSEAMKLDVRPGGVHEYWSYAEGILNRIDINDIMARRIVKALAIIHSVRKSFSHRPNNELLAFSLGVSPHAEEFQDAINYLKNNKLIIHRTSNGCWEFLNRSKIDISKEINSIIEQYKPKEHTLRVFLDRNIKPNYYPARRYIDEYGTIRYFTGIYRTVNEIFMIDNWEDLLKEQDYADGFIVFILASDQAELSKAKDYIMNHDEGRVVFVVPHVPINIFDYLREMFALNILKSSSTLHEEDPRVEKELEFLYDDIVDNIKTKLKQLTDPAKNGEWYYQRELLKHKSFSGICRYISKICMQYFNNTPIINNEALNRKNPSLQQINASQKVIDGLFQINKQSFLGLKGNGPDVAIYKTVLKNTGIIVEDESCVKVCRPPNTNMTLLWDKIEQYIIQEDEEKKFETLIDELQLPPWGIRKGVIPVVFAAVLSQHLSNLTIKYRGRVVVPVKGKHITDIVANPDYYSFVYHSVDVLKTKMWIGLEKIFCGKDDPQGETPLYIICKNIADWYVSLPNYGRQSANLDETIKNFREILRNCQSDPYNELLIKLPECLNFHKEYSQEEINAAINAYKEKLQNIINSLRLELEEKLKSIFGEAKSAKSSLNKWLTQISEKNKINIDTYHVGDVYGDVLFSYSINNNYNDEDWINELSKEITGLPLEYWTDNTLEQFVEIIQEAKERIQREFESGKTFVDKDIVKVYLGLDEQEKTITFKKSELSPSAKNLLNTLKRKIDTTGKYLNQDERMELGVELLQFLFDKKKG